MYSHPIREVDKEELKKLEPAFDEVEVREEEIVFVIMRSEITGNLFDCPPEGMTLKEKE